MAFFLAVVTAQAQTDLVHRADIPFDFIVGSQAFEASEYLIGISDPTDLATILTVRDITVRDENGHELHAAAVMKNGSNSKDDHTSLVFDRLGEDYVLSKIAAPDFGFNAPKSKVATRLSKNQKLQPEIVSLILRKPKSNME